MVDVVVLGEETAAKELRFGEGIEVAREVVDVFECLEL